MKVVLTGAGSGGHITPLLAVAESLKKTDPKCSIVFIGQTDDPFTKEISKSKNIKKSYSVRAGKFRRYHGEGWRQLLDVKTMYLNVRDFFYVLVGFWQSRKLLKSLKPDVIFIKGGFVGVPVGLAAASLKIPYITHDSDSIPGLANRIIARWATWHAVALPKELYAYPSNKTVTTGIPLRSEFKAVANKEKAEFRKKIDLPDNSQLLFIIGGGLGSDVINKAAIESLPHLLVEFPKLFAVHITGKNHFDEIKARYDTVLSNQLANRVKLYDFTSDVHVYSGASDLVVTRAGATNLAEFSVQGKACIIVPSPFLTGGHQLKNAQFYADKQAGEVLDNDALEQDPLRLARQVSELLQNPQRITEIAMNISRLAGAGGADKITDLIIKTAAKRHV